MEQENFQASINKLQLLISEKDGVIEFLNLEAAENNKKLSELLDELESEKKLETSFNVIISTSLINKYCFLTLIYKNQNLFFLIINS